MTIVWIVLALWLVGLPLAFLAIFGVGEQFDHARRLREQQDVEREAAEHARPVGNVGNVVQLESRRRRRVTSPSLRGTGWPEPLPSTSSRTPRDRRGGGAA